MGTLVLEKLSKRYGDALAVAEISLNAKQGDLVALLGPSGCGKTTTLRMVAGFITPTSGTVRIGDKDVTQLPAHARNTGMVFQSYALFPHMTVAENVAFGLEMRKVGRAEREERVREALRLVRLDHLIDRYPRQMSGGQQQRVALARALVINPAVFLLDEPLSNLDAKLRGEVRLEIRNLQQRLGLTTLMVTHDQEEALTMADHLVVMDHGRVRQAGTAEDLYERPADAFVASFVGRSNVLPGKLEKNGEFRLAGGVLLPCALDSAPRPGGQLFALRPERIRIAPGNQTGQQARVSNITYLGAQTEYLLDLGADTPAMFASMATPAADDPLRRLKVGDVVSMNWDRDAVRLLAAETQTGDEP